MAMGFCVEFPPIIYKSNNAYWSIKPIIINQQFPGATTDKCNMFLLKWLQKF